MTLLARLVAVAGAAIGVTVAVTGFFTGSIPLLVGWGVVAVALILWFVTPNSGTSSSQAGFGNLPEDHPVRRRLEENQLS